MLTTLAVYVQERWWFVVLVDEGLLFAGAGEGEVPDLIVEFLWQFPEAGSQLLRGRFAWSHVVGCWMLAMEVWVLVWTLMSM